MCVSIIKTVEISAQVALWRVIKLEELVYHQHYECGDNNVFRQSASTKATCKHQNHYPTCNHRTLSTADARSTISSLSRHSVPPSRDFCVSRRDEARALVMLEAAGIIETLLR